LLTATLIGQIGRLDTEELDRLQAAIDVRRRELAGRECSAPMSTILERRSHGSGVLQLEMHGESGPYWYFHFRRSGRPNTIYIGKAEDPEVKMAQLMTGISG
jgi:hypothetical protein